MNKNKFENTLTKTVVELNEEDFRKLFKIEVRGLPIIQKDGPMIRFTWEESKTNEIKLGPSE